MIQCDVKWFNREANDLRYTQMIQCDVEWLSNDCINKAELSYLSFYLRAGRSFDVKGGGGSYFEKAEIILKLPSPQFILAF